MNLCIQCKFSKDKRSWFDKILEGRLMKRYNLICTHPDAVLELSKKIDPIDGFVSPARKENPSCVDERSSYGICGKSGKLFEPRQRK